MLQSEFDRLTIRPYTEEEFSDIHYVYCYHPAVQSKKDIADLWTIGGICLIKDMMTTARRVEEEKCRLVAARTEYERARNRYKELIRWLTNGKDERGES